MPRSPLRQRAPKHQQIFDALHGEILAGKYPPGGRLPSEAALVGRFGSSRITVGRAVRELRARGLVDRRAGSGTFVRAAQTKNGGGLLFGLVIPDLGETEIFEPICQGMASAPEAARHALLWSHAAVGFRAGGSEFQRGEKNAGDAGAVRRMMDAHGPDGILCGNDRTAGRLMQTLLGLGYKLPHDVGIVGFDDVEYASLLPVPLTTIRQPCREIGAAAMAAMLARVAQPESLARDILLDCRLVVRASGGAISPTRA